MKINSILVHGSEIEDEMGSVVTPIYQTSTFKFKDAQQGANRFAGKEEGYIYTRLGNPTIKALEKKLALLEHGYDALACASGMAAVNTALLSLLQAGDHMISTDAIYGCTFDVFTESYLKFGINISFVDTCNLDLIEENIKPNTKVIYLETPANPTLKIADLEAICKIAKQHNIYVVVDNTFASPILQNPIDFGADLVVHSLTKFINGHADIVGGAVIAKTEELYKIIYPTFKNMGFNMDPHQAFLVDRGSKTMNLRVMKCQENAQKVAEFLEKHDKVASVAYPGLKSHPQYDLAKKQMRGPGSMISFELKGGYAAGQKLMDSVKLIALAVSLGGIESLIQHPASMTHAHVSEEAKKAAFITEGLVRLSVGIEDIEDLLEDIDQALQKI
ncbi:MAG TPA: aminotransferase class I/II-fold pyridoxal phosphate-dependent enzyme [Bacteroidales bacterium]|jgi:methionine-gamma-lyase|nr:aminotransferase class I/II-fold pyridoxal phosphate-dependent enzyme [Bacteroidales bacterium]HOV55605.1 aminotransferase class I/II-fold pyridoxal phosphate-dependent enzyme [Bacteroidales bacterium]HPX46342.1 aminotransferase class I/II-fold pyridoxal phosphate-dependent enzyme [Bacteroidales bacterium]HQC60394.1 aminotransferase class I/II-fold pyridoxal phosphate-dependent enzyme [Bacteroidales bacterium]HRC78967.1 aminotransferase class I/II-fold pyridoxal phosphate-dependent enzyme [B